MASAEQFQPGGNYWPPSITASAHLNPLQLEMPFLYGLPQPFSFCNPYFYNMMGFGIPHSTTSAFLSVPQKPISDMAYPVDQKPIYGSTAPSSVEGGQSPVVGESARHSPAGGSRSTDSSGSIDSTIDAILARSRSPAERYSRVSCKVEGSEPSDPRSFHLDTTSSSSSNSDSGTAAVSPCSSLSRSTPGSILASDLNVKCSICDDRASGYHYGVTSCEGCKGFFRRTVQKNIDYSCHKDGTCSVNRITRNRCQACRFRKCCDKGMAKEAVRNDRNRKRKIRDVQEEEQLQATARLHQLITQVVAVHNDTNEVSQCDTESIEVLLFLRDQVLGSGLRNIIQFGTSLPGYQELAQADKVTLLKAALLEILILRSAFVLCGKEVNVDVSIKLPDLFNTVSNGEIIECVCRLRDSLSQLQVYQEEIALLSAVCLFCPTRPGLLEPEKVEKLQEGLLESLRIQVQLRKPSQPHVFAKLLMKVSDLRSLVLKAGTHEGSCDDAQTKDQNTSA